MCRPRISCRNLAVGTGSEVVPGTELRCAGHRNGRPLPVFTGRPCRRTRRSTEYEVTEDDANTPGDPVARVDEELREHGVRTALLDNCSPKAAPSQRPKPPHGRAAAPSSAPCTYGSSLVTDTSKRLPIANLGRRALALCQDRGNASGSARRRSTVTLITRLFPPLPYSADDADRG